MTGKKKGKLKTNTYLDCPCGAKAMVYQTGQCRWFSHCPACGRLTFFSSAQVFERLKAGGKLCVHEPELKMCKDGISQTSWCPFCRVRTFQSMPPVGEGGQ
jgi:hypothetical protein